MTGTRLRVFGMVRRKRTGMRNLAESAAFLGVLLWAPLVLGAPRELTPALAERPVSHTQALKPACARQGSCTAQAGAGTPYETHPAESGDPASAANGVCEALTAAAAANDLPINFFTRLIWQESRFDAKAVSRAGAQGVAQFMPATASWRGLSDPFDAVEAITKSGELLGDLRREFGNLGLAAAAYNAGSRRVRDWLAGRRGLPGETRAYVRLVTGRTAEEWAAAQAAPPEMPVSKDVPCQQAAGLFVYPSSGAAEPKAAEPWGVELVGSSSEAKALTAYRQLQQKYSAILAGHEPRVVFYGVARDMGWARVRVGAESRVSAEKLCAELRGAGAGCDVLRN
jgi:hypothetical protein